MSVEVERKFVCESDIQDKLKNIGAVCIGQSEFKDRYYDSPDYTLTLRDFWLRKREESWELKCPAFSRTDVEKIDEALCTKYREVTDLKKIQAVVKTVCSGAVEGSLDVSEQKMTDNYNKNETWLKDLMLVCFAEYTTQRCSYVFEEDGGDGKVRVDLDQADFGYCVGEIEVLVSEGGDMQSAQHRIQKMAEKLGLGGEKRIQGKMDVYLQRYCPDHYAKLIKAHIL
ncbi:thiamine-triphosphatase [Astyanax mexicanus]|uniref:Thiamine-triphosphatase n=2 Tax=Astyanax mexicanus TaxID=7994 RepID=A0A8B9KMX5_ASTMX|nr:thiamine-triphosphatase [Astyanax mexicanus]KAG9283243.1 thiamine-triphosphatase [Astyanax mexicanus]